MMSRFSIPSLALCLGVLSLGMAPASAAPLLISQSFTPPPNSGAPPSTTAGASRGGAACQNAANPTIITPLMPKAGAFKRAKVRRRRSRRQQPYFSLTLQNRPSFFWHVNPKSMGGTASFLLVERNSSATGEQHRLMYEATLDLPNTPGIVRLDLPQTAPTLQPGRQYEWFLSFNCDPMALDSQVHLSGWLELAQPSPKLSQQLSQASLSQRAQLLSDAGIWQDALMTQIQRLQSTPNNVEREQQWQAFLNSVGLGQLAQASLVSARVTEILAY